VFRGRRPCYGGIKTSELKVQRYKGPDGRALLPLHKIVSMTPTPGKWEILHGNVLQIIEGNFLPHTHGPGSGRFQMVIYSE
jgi:hypothetical protein